MPDNYNAGFDRPAPNPMSTVVSVRKVAEMAGWPYRKMLRHLLASDRELRGTLLTKTGKGKHTRYSTTLGALEQLHPAWFAKAGSLREDVTEQASEIQVLTAMVDELTRQVADTTRALGGLGTRVRNVESRLGTRGTRVPAFETGDF